VVGGVVCQYVNEQAQEDNDQGNSGTNLHERLRLIICFSKVPMNAQKNYTTTEKDIMAIVTVICLNKIMLLNSSKKRIIFSDHNNLLSF
jgi:RNase H-like domain found in reverse transcriptase